MRGIAGLVLASVLTVAGCYTGPNASHFAATVEELDVPAGWQLAKSEVFGPDEDDACSPSFSSTCPSASRAFLVDGDAADAYAEAKDAASAAGFAITEEFSADCMGPPSGPACSFFSAREGDQVTVSVYHSGAEAGLGDDLRGAAAVRITAHRSL